MIGAVKSYISIIKIAAVVVASIGLFAFGHQVGKNSERVKWQAEKIAQQEQYEKELDAAKTKQEKIKEAIRRDYESTISKLHADVAAAGRLRINNKACVPDAESTKRSDADATGTRLLPEPYSSDLRALMLEADSISASCNALQSFIKQNGMD